MTRWGLKSRAAPCPHRGFGYGEAASARSCGHCSRPYLKASSVALAMTIGEVAQVPGSIRGRVRAASHPPCQVPAMLVPGDSGETFREIRDSFGDVFFFLFSVYRWVFPGQGSVIRAGRY